ncbi:helix-turn-helix domain-containing protein [Actinomyces faecalis]|uniref:helix-turn-helix domain-containing protein n=1 Tax=Actinomyces faecalis TaxID=2722820 RepID=UPI0015565434
MSSRETLTQIAAGRLRAEMAFRRRSSSDLASALGLSQSSASRRMTGEVSMDLDEIETVVKWLDIPVQRLIEEQAA